jgi:hypothetical protein
MTAEEEASKLLEFIFKKYSYQNRFLSPRDENFTCITKAIQEVKTKIKQESVWEMKEYYKEVIYWLKKRANGEIELFEKDIQNMSEKYKTHYSEYCNNLKVQFI